MDLERGIDLHSNSPHALERLRWSLPWLVRYPFWRLREWIATLRQTTASVSHLIFVVANHFEPAWSYDGVYLPWSEQQTRVDGWAKLAQAIGRSIKDHDGTPFRHTYFYPAEQYHAPLLENIAGIQREGLGEIEIHLHHGVDRPDTPLNLRKSLVDFRDRLAEEHKCLSRELGSGSPKYAFVHGNLALANSAGGRFCGVDSEMQILAETGCYADLTLPSAPDQSQVPRINAIYQCRYPLNKKVPHRAGPNLKVGAKPELPVIFTGPLVFDWRRRVYGLPIPRLDGGALASNYPLDLKRLEHWTSARIGVAGRPDWIFIKLYCHGFFPSDQTVTIGEPMQRFMEQILNLAERERHFKIHFATAREAFNLMMAAVDGRNGEPGKYRDYRLKAIMSE